MRQMYHWGPASQARKAGLDPRMQAVLDKYITIARQDTTILEGLRSAEQCYINFGAGRTVNECIAGGCPGKYSQPAKPKVTWLKHALSSNHYAEFGHGKAVDLYPFPLSLVFPNKPAAQYMPLFQVISDDMFAAASAAGVKIRWGADWDGDKKLHEPGESDNPHFELLA